MRKKKVERDSMGKKVRKKEKRAGERERKGEKGRERERELKIDRGSIVRKVERWKSLKDR